MSAAPRAFRPQLGAGILARDPSRRSAPFSPPATERRPAILAAIEERKQELDAEIRAVADAEAYAVEKNAQASAAASVAAPAAPSPPAE